MSYLTELRTSGTDVNEIELEFENLIKSISEKPELDRVKEILKNTQDLINRYRAISTETILTIELMRSNDNKDIADRLERVHADFLNMRNCAQIK